ncbi:PREDICTED: uncharacterized protein LOC108567397 isoform X1 [Nicrophorus vespilloides]|uniref:Uncharacterized protein LOC108567397 isoform X1 n=1 Tax=Nicrophorus vespilloides TaxID=110193 RepID=A0ABM1N916_NICVS|nr:PREDICTED: uncharacterized protein LOC108567397 isoform X1 [Nicrophorus vespilloides]
MSKVVVLFILAFATTAIFCAEKNIPAAYKVIGKSIRASCLAETGANEDVVNAANDGVFPNDKPLWCYLKCLFQRMGTVKGENIDFKKLMTVFPGKISDTYVPGFKYCKDNAPVGADGCETLFLFNKCLFEHNPECADTNVPAVFKDIAKSLRATCLAETGANEDVVNAVFKGEFGNDKQVWCYFKCILEKMGKLKGDNVDFKEFIDGFPDDLRGSYAPSVKHCEDGPVGADICETVFLFNKCMYEHNPEIFFVF